MEAQSHGGKIIGYTKSGKPIYDTHDHPEHGKYNLYDAEDAAYLHADAKEKAQEERDRHQKGSVEYERLNDRVKYHYGQFAHFYNKCRIMRKASKKHK